MSNITDFLGGGSGGDRLFFPNFSTFSSYMDAEQGDGSYFRFLNDAVTYYDSADTLLWTIIPIDLQAVADYIWFQSGMYLDGGFLYLITQDNSADDIMLHKVDISDGTFISFPIQSPGALVNDYKPVWSKNDGNIFTVYFATYFIEIDITSGVATYTSGLPNNSFYLGIVYPDTSQITFVSVIDNTKVTLINYNNSFDCGPVVLYSGRQMIRFGSYAYIGTTTTSDDTDQAGRIPTEEFRQVINEFLLGRFNDTYTLEHL